MTFLLCLACATLAWDEPPKAAAPAPAAIDVVSALEKTLADAIARAEPSVVAIHRDRTDDSKETTAVRGRASPPRQVVPGMIRARPMMDLDDVVSLDFGSGVVVGAEGQILTAFHVVKGARGLIVKAAGRQSFNAEVVAADPRSDLAVIAPIAEPGVEPPKLKAITIGDAGTLRKGSFLVVLGNPFNAARRDGKASASWGILSNVARRVDPELDDDQFARRATPQLPNYPTLLQLDAKLNLGMSGGAVVNMKGELVGVTTMASSPAGFDAMAGYAIPMDRTGRRAVETLKQGKEVEYGLLGVTSHQNTTNIVDEVTLNSPAALGELQQKDEIIGVNGEPVVDFDSLILAVNGYSAGDAIRLQIRRGGQEMEKTIVLGKFPVHGEIIVTAPPPAWRGLRVDYLTMLPRGNVGLLEAAPAPGVVVRNVEPESAAAQAGLKAGQIVHQVAGKAVANPGQFAKAVADLTGPVTLLTDQGPIVVP